MKTRVHFIALVIAITTTFVTQTVHAQTPQVIVMTEESSSVLDVTVNGTDITATGVNNTSADHWIITLPQGVGLFGDGNIGWNEPENPGLIQTNLTGWNRVTWDFSTQLSVTSDTSTNAADDHVINGGPIIIPGGVLEFTDVSDVAVTAPDTGSTFGLLALALAALFGARRLRSIRLA